MRRQFLTFLGVGALALAGAGGALAQDASPLAELGLPELTVTATAAGFELSASEVPAGRYLVTLVNESENPDIAAGFVRLSEGNTLEDLSYADELAAGTPIPEFPDTSEFAWLYETYIAGGVSAATPQGVIDLRGGEYGIWGDDPAAPWPAGALTVSGDPEARIEGPELEAVATIVEEGSGGNEFTFRVDGELAAGPQVVEFLNASDQPHFVIGFQYPEEITVEQAVDFITFDPSSGDTPAPDMLDETQLSFAFYVPVHSVGTTQWAAVDLAPGQAILVCFVPDPLAEGLPHAFEGMVSLVPVGG